MNLADINQCTGCASCANVCGHGAISMVADSEGFFQPVVDASKCANCLLCEKSCPVINASEISCKSGEPNVYAMWSIPDRSYSSSGGAFSACARIVLSKGGIVVGAAFDENLHLHHTAINNIEDLDKLRGSKYVQSEIGNIYKQIKTFLRKDKYVLFCGTPCQVAGLNAYLSKSYDKLITMDLVCHGVPSDKIWSKYIEKLKRENPRFQNLTGFEFRKLNGWGISPYIDVNGKRFSLYDQENLYMTAFEQSAIFRRCCYKCQYAKTSRIGDVTVADFWGIGRHGIPFKYDTSKGVSLVIANTEKGKEMIAQLQNVFIEKRSLNEAVLENHNLTKHSVTNYNRDNIIKAFLDDEMSLKDIDKEFNINRFTLKGFIKKYAEKYHIFDFVKNIYNKYKSL